jgi:hypothetical protein
MSWNLTPGFQRLQNARPADITIGSKPSGPIKGFEQFNSMTVKFQLDGSTLTVVPKNFADRTR